VRLAWVALALASGCGRYAFDPVPAPPDTAGDAAAINALAHWSFDEGTGTTTRDLTGGGHDLSLINNPAWTAGMFGSALSMDAGAMQHLEAPTIDLSHTNAVTVSVWFIHNYGAGVPFDHLFESSDNFNLYKDAFGIFPDDVDDCGAPQLLLSMQGDAGYSSACYEQPTSNVWHHLVAVFDKSRPSCCELAFYIDGALQQPVTLLNASDNTNAFGAAKVFLFARGGTGSFSDGGIDELLLIDRALTPAEIAAL
jgi:alpha-L-arabinofuranosidase